VLGYQECGLAGKAGGDPTGLQAATTYNFRINHNSYGTVDKSITTAAALTYTDVIALLNAEMTAELAGVVWAISGGDLRCTARGPNVAIYEPTTITETAGYQENGLVGKVGGDATGLGVKTAGYQENGLVGKAGGDATGLAAWTQGYQECGLAGKAGGDPTGLAGVTQYYFKVNVDGAGVVEYNITTAADVTFTAVIALMNAAVAGAVFGLSGGDLRCTSSTYGTGSSIALSAGTTGADLFGTLTGFVAFDAAVAGVTSEYFFKVNIDGAGLTEYSILVEADDTFTAVMALMNAEITGATFALSGGDLRCTSALTGATSSIALDAGTGGTDLFATLTGWAAFDVAVAGTTPEYFFKVNLDGAGLVEKSILVTDTDTFTVVLGLMNAQMTGGLAGVVWSLTGGDLRCTSPTTGVTSSIALDAGTSGTDLFVTLTGWAAFDTAVPGYTDSLFAQLTGFTALDAAVAGSCAPEDPYDLSLIPSSGETFVYPFNEASDAGVFVWGDTNVTGTVTLYVGPSPTGPWAAVDTSVDPTTAGDAMPVPAGFLSTGYMKVGVGAYTGGPLRAVATATRKNGNAIL